MLKKSTDSMKHAQLEARAGKQKLRPPPNYFSRREQVRLFLMCSTLMLVLFMMNEARKPGNWDWLWAAEQADPVQQEAIDTKIDMVKPSLPADGFQSERPNADQTFSATGTKLEGFLPGIDRALFAKIEDNTVMRASENEVWWAVLAALERLPVAELEAQSLGVVGFTQLFRQTDFYRGRVVTVQGTVRRLEAIEPRANAHAIREMYRWILEPFGGNAPVVVYSLEKPVALTVGEGLREQCEFTGVCFKRWAYQAADGTRVAPLLLAKAPRWTPPTPAEVTELPSPLSMVAGGLCLLLLSSVIAAVVYRASNVRRADIERLRVAELGLQENLDQQSVLPGTIQALQTLERTHPIREDS